MAIYKTYDELQFIDDFMFCHVLMENEDLCKEIAEMVTGRKIREIIVAEDQKSIRITEDGKRVRFDVYFEDADGIIYDIEMQAVPSRNLPRRSRYYQGMIDLNFLSKGSDYSDLPDSYIIFICTFDLFQKGRHIYSFEPICREDADIPLNDGTHRVFLSPEGDKNDCSEKMRDFLNYVAGKGADGSFSRRLDEAVRRAREKEEWRLDYKTLLEKYKDERLAGRAEGLSEGIQIGRNEGIQIGRNEANREAEKERKELLKVIEQLQNELKKVHESPGQE